MTNYPPDFRPTKWKGELAAYTARVDALLLVTPDVEARLKRFPGLLRRHAPDLVHVKHRSLIFANQNLASAAELLQSIQLLWNEGHLLAAGHAIRLVFEVLASLRYLQQEVLRKAVACPECPSVEDTLQRLSLGTNSGPILPAGIEERIEPIRVGKFLKVAEAAAEDFQEMYAFLCDTSHPTYMHSYLYHLTLDFSWSNDVSACETHRIVEKMTSAAEAAVGGIGVSLVEIYDECLPDIEKEIASYNS